MVAKVMNGGDGGVPIDPVTGAKFEPFGFLMLLQPIKRDTTASGIALVGAGADDYQTPRMKVIAVGPEVKQARVGDVILAEPGAMGNVLVRPDHPDPGMRRLVFLDERRCLGIDRAATE